MDKEKLTKEQLTLNIWNYRPENRDDLMPYRRCVPDIMDMILTTEIVSEDASTPNTEDTELLEAQKRFPVGSWFNVRAWGKTLFKCSKVERCENTIYVFEECASNFWKLDNCTPATLPHAPVKWRCMKTDAPDDIRTVLIALDGYPNCGYLYHGKWVSHGVYLDISKYKTAKWCEIPKEG